VKTALVIAAAILCSLAVQWGAAIYIQLTGQDLRAVRVATKVASDNKAADPDILTETYQPTLVSSGSRTVVTTYQQIQARMMEQKGLERECVIRPVVMPYLTTWTTELRFGFPFKGLYFREHGSMEPFSLSRVAATNRTEALAWPSQTVLIPYGIPWPPMLGNVALGMLLFLTSRAALLFAMRHARSAQGRCPNCGYEAGPAICPECGRTQSPVPPAPLQPGAAS
jgi:hypothetical protein